MTTVGVRRSAVACPAGSARSGRSGPTRTTCVLRSRYVVSSTASQSSGVESVTRECATAGKGSAGIVSTRHTANPDQWRKDE